MNDESNLGEALSLNIIEVKHIIAVEQCYYKDVKLPPKKLLRGGGFGQGQLPIQKIHNS